MNHGTVTSYTIGRQRKWRFQFRTEAGQQIRRRGFTTKATATTALREAQELSEAVFAPVNETVARYLMRWLELRSAGGAIKESTADSYLRTLKLALPLIGHLPLQGLTADHLDQAYRSLLQTGGREGLGRSPRTVRYVHTVIRKALADAERKGLISRNPALRADPPTNSSAKANERVVWSLRETQAFLAWRGLPTYRSVAWELGLGTGLRRGELAGLRWDDLEDGRLHVRRTRTTASHRVVESTPKTARSVRSVQLPADLLQTLRSWRAEQGQLFLRTGQRCEYVLTDDRLNPWHPDALGRAWTRDAATAVQAGVVGARMTLHDCRHWHATQLVRAGVDLNTVSNRLGHATPAFTLSIYGHSDDEQDRQAAATIGALMKPTGTQ